MEREVRSHDYFPVEDTYIRKGSAFSTQTAWFTRFGKTGHEVCTSDCPNSTHPFTRSKQPIPGSNWHQFCMQVLHHPQALLALCIKHILHRIFVCEAPAATISPAYAAALQTRASDVASCNPNTSLLWHHSAARARLAGANAGVASCSPNARLARAQLVGAAWMRQPQAVQSPTCPRMRPARDAYGAVYARYSVYSVVHKNAVVTSCGPSQPSTRLNKCSIYPKISTRRFLLPLHNL